MSLMDKFLNVMRLNPAADVSAFAIYASIDAHH